MFLQAHQVTLTRDVAEMADGIASRHPQFRNLSATPSRGWRYVYNRVAIGSARLGTSYATQLRYASTGSEDIVVSGAFSGRETMSARGESRSLSDMPAFCPLFPIAGEVERCEFWTLRLARPRLLAALEALDQPPAFDAVIERNWLRALPNSPKLRHFLFHLFHHIEEFGPPVGGEARAMEELIYAHAARTLVIEDNAPAAAPNPAAFRRCADFIEANLGEALSVMEVAGAAHLSLRGTQALFQRHAGISITGYILRRRLLRARELLAAPAPPDSITDLALAMGFNQPGYFTRRYRAAFGETPQETLRRGR